MDRPTLPYWVCHKTVHAAKIVLITSPSASGGVFLHLEGIHEPLEVSKDWDKRYMPSVGGYYVQYADGYASYSPQKAFEEGYTRTEEPPR